MLKEISFVIKGIKNENSKYLIETEVDVLSGVKDAHVDYKSGECSVELDDDKTSQDKIIKAIKNLGYKIDVDDFQEKASMNEYTYFVEGMHCASCEVLIEKRLLKEENIKSVEAKASKSQVIIEYENTRPSSETLDRIFQKDKFIFSDYSAKTKSAPPLVSFKAGEQLIINKQKLHNFLVISGVSLLFIIIFIVLHKSGLSALVSVNAKSALPIFIVFGVLAGFSSCAALIGGIILSMSKQWAGLYSEKDSTFQRLKPHLLFNTGRLISYALLGAVLGAIGNIFQLSAFFTSALVIGVSIIMLFLALQMLGVKYFQRFQITMPKFVTRYIADESNFQGHYMPMIMGAATFFLPCGFTITAQGLALTSGSVWQGSLIMLFFAIGTLPALFTIGLSSVVFTKKPHIANRFLKIAGVIVLFFAVFNINSQLNVLGFASLDDISLGFEKTAIASEDGFPDVVDGKQILKMAALSYAYQPKRLKVRAGIPVRWEITDKGTSGCTNAIMSRGLFDGQIDLTPGTVSVKEFTPEEPGRYKFSCWMGMISGTVDVVDVGKDGSTVPLDLNAEVIDSGAKGCGCGGGGSDTGSCGG